MGAATIRVVIADDHPIVRDGLSTALGKTQRLTVVGVATNFPDVIEILATQAVDALVLDLSGMQGAPLTVVARVRRDYPSVAIVIFSSLLDLAPELLKAGALGYVVKEELAQQLLQAIEAAHRGERFLSPVVAEYVEQTAILQQQWRLAPKELSVLKLLAQGLTTEAIGQELGIDPRSVQNYITTLRRKIGAEGRTQLASWYRRLYGDGAQE